MKCELCGKEILDDEKMMVVGTNFTEWQRGTRYHKSCYDKSIEEKLEVDYITVESKGDGFKVTGRVTAEVAPQAEPEVAPQEGKKFKTCAYCGKEYLTFCVNCCNEQPEEGIQCQQCSGFISGIEKYSDPCICSKPTEPEESEVEETDESVSIDLIKNTQRGITRYTKYQIGKSFFIVRSDYPVIEHFHKGETVSITVLEEQDNRMAKEIKLRKEKDVR